MTALLITFPCVALYLAGFVLGARLEFRRVRPFTEPLSCSYGYRGHEHIASCYARSGTFVDSVNQALFQSLACGLGWPLVLGAVLALRAVRLVVGSKPLPEERAAAVKRLERDLDIRDHR